MSRPAILDPRPHDLVWIANPRAFRPELSPGQPGGVAPDFVIPEKPGIQSNISSNGLRDAGSHDPLPDWALAACHKGVPVVVRRAAAPSPNLVPVGLRGRSRSERLGGWVPLDRIVRRMSPEALCSESARRRHPALARFPVVRALASLAPALNSTGLSWGPTGSVGFALATGLLVLRQDSDLDLLVRAPSRLAAELCAMLMMLAKQAGCRVDIQVDTGSGGFALAEWARSGQRVLLKTNHGPILTDDPWGGGVPRSVKP